jgi:hypothetical protein
VATLAGASDRVKESQFKSFSNGDKGSSIASNPHALL